MNIPRIEKWIVKFAELVSSACNFVSIRLDHYVESKQWEWAKLEQHTFPKEWFEKEEEE